MENNNYTDYNDTNNKPNKKNLLYVAVGVGVRIIRDAVCMSCSVVCLPSEMRIVLLASSFFPMALITYEGFKVCEVQADADETYTP